MKTLAHQPVTAEWTEVEFDPTASGGADLVVATSAAQREIFSPSMLDPDASRAYNHSITIHFEGALDVDALYSALLNLIDRHEALRGRFSSDGSEFRVARQLAFGLPIVDLSSGTEAERDAAYVDFVRTELDFLFDLVHGPLFRATLLKVDPNRWRLVFTCHHVIVDGWSLKVILSELCKLYNAVLGGVGGEGTGVAISFIEYLRSVVQLEKDKAPGVRAYWKEVFRDGVPVLDLPLDRPRGRSRTFRSKREDYRIERPVFDRLKEEGAKRGVSAFLTVLSSFALYLHRVSGSDDLIVGVPAAGQIHGGKAGLMGHDARLLPIRSRLESGDTFGTFSARLMETFLSAYEHQWITLPELISELGVRVDHARVPLMPVMFNFDPGMKANDFDYQGLKAHHFFNHRNYETFEISVNAVIENGDLVLECAYNSDLFDDPGIHERLTHLEKLMRSIGDSPERPLRELPLVTEASLAAMDEALNRTEMDYDRRLCVDERIARTARGAPDRVAVEFGEKRLTYGELWESSGRIASALLRLSAELGLGKNPLIGAYLERSEAMVPVLLGIWRAGGAFVPMDPSYPKDRLQYIAESSGIRLIVTSPGLEPALAGDFRYCGIEELLKEEIAPSLERERLPSRDAEDLAYVLYTSGSTGKPKGVQVPHRALHNFLCAMGRRPGLRPEDRVLAITTLAFDIAELELWFPLVTGARTVIVDRATATDGQALIETIERKEISFIQATPATWRLLFASDWAGDSRITALCGGEALPGDLAQQIVAKVGALWNVYGPTETTVWSTLDRVGTGPITIGKPIGNTLAYILDPSMNRVPRGVVGELWLGGDGVTRGYLGREDLTRERFIANPFTGSGHIYKTGDLVRLRTDGRIEYVGRNDFQVKVRGYRIELGEVQSALARHPAIHECVVSAMERTPGDAFLVAFYCLKAGKSVGAAELRELLRKTLPDYMVPSHFFELGRLPLTPNGKVDVKALTSSVALGPIPGTSPATDDNIDPPRTETEIYMARTWSELLGGGQAGERIARSSRFFELGGSSLLAIQLIQRVKAERGVRLTAKQVLLDTLEQIAAAVGGGCAKAAPVPVAVPGSASSIAIPRFFGRPGKRKFGCFHAGRAGAAQGILICPPLGHEYIRAHALIRGIASVLSRNGHPVFRFDYYGHGDSSGSSREIRVDDLRESVLDAADELRAASGAASLKVIALRASSLVVSEVVGRLCGDGDCLLVEPVFDGRLYMDTLRTTQKKRWAAYPYPKKWIETAKESEILGALYAAEWIAEMEALRAEPGRFGAVNAPVAPGWDDFRRIEEIWHSPQLVREIERWLAARERA